MRFHVFADRDWRKRSPCAHNCHRDIASTRLRGLYGNKCSISPCHPRPRHAYRHIVHGHHYAAWHDGIALAREGRRLRPDIRVLLASGYSRDRLNADDDMDFVAKPYQVPELARRLKA